MEMHSDWEPWRWLLLLLPSSLIVFEQEVAPTCDRVEMAREAVISIALACGRTSSTAPLDGLFMVLTAWKFYGSNDVEE